MTKLAIVFLAMTAFGADLAGKWDFVWNTPGGERRSVLTFTSGKDGLEVTFPESKAPMKVVVDGDKVRVTGKLYSAEAGSEGTFQLDGTLSGSTMKGQASWDEHSMSFDAKRQNSN